MPKPVNSCDGLLSYSATQPPTDSRQVPQKLICLPTHTLEMGVYVPSKIETLHCIMAESSLLAAKAPLA